VVLVSIRKNIDLSTSTGRMFTGLFSVLADYGLSIIRERTKAGMQAARARGS
jgi:DNA invertase Pin-like site-specific DNA recombinase